VDQFFRAPKIVFGLGDRTGQNTDMIGSVYLPALFSRGGSRSLPAACGKNQSGAHNKGKNHQTKSFHYHSSIKISNLYTLYSPFIRLAMSITNKVFNVKPLLKLQF
jgi:hypothetical protein